MATCKTDLPSTCPLRAFVPSPLAVAAVFHPKKTQLKPSKIHAHDAKNPFAQIDGMDDPDDEEERLEGLQQIISDSTAQAAAAAVAAATETAKSPDESSV